MKVLVYGAGPLGTIFAARLRESGNEVTILARGRRLAELREHGLVLEDAATGKRTVTRVTPVDSLAPGDAYDLIAVIMRKNQIAPILPTLAANRRTPNVLFMGNNAGGPGEYVDALGSERVLFGFGTVGGMRAGYGVRYLGGKGRRKSKVTLGSVDGRITARMVEIAEMFNSAGFQSVFSRNMDAWLKSHVAVISPIALALYGAGGDNYELARSRGNILQMIRAVREGFRVLHALYIPLTPAALRIYEWIPEPVLVPLLERLFNSPDAEIGMAAHANAAPDEMRCLADEFRVLARLADVPTPAFDRLYGYLNLPATPLQLLLAA